MATIYYFPAARMEGDIDNIVKPVLDGMIAVAYPDDKHIERVVVQKFEPGIAWLFPSPSAILSEAIDREKPCLYVRMEDDLGWRQAS
jgi:crossover junction endodeoxyribonuclease RusA